MNTYLPYETVVSDIKTLSRDSALLTLKFREAAIARDFTFTAGQFIELSLLGYGEVPVGLASSPKDKRHIQVSVRKVGNVTEAVHRLETGDTVGVRGPFGNGFKDEWIKGKHLLAVSGGCGLPPIRSLILHALENSKDFKGITLLYGSRTQQELLFRDEYKDWMGKADVLLTVDTEDAPDTGLAVDCGVGVVTKLIDKIEITDDMVAALCGPPIMYRFVVKKLLETGMKPENILVSLERRMKCGLGKCQHCTSGGKYVCLDGPVFTYKQVMGDYGGL